MQQELTKKRNSFVKSCLSRYRFVICIPRLKNDSKKLGSSLMQAVSTIHGLGSCIGSGSVRNYWRIVIIEVNLVFRFDERFSFAIPSVQFNIIKFLKKKKKHFEQLAFSIFSTSSISGSTIF